MGTCHVVNVLLFWSLRPTPALGEFCTWDLTSLGRQDVGPGIMAYRFQLAQCEKKHNHLSFALGLQRAW